MAGHPPRVLLAEDHALVAAGIRKLLEPRFAVVAVVGDGPSLLEAAAEHQPELILTDVSMPEMDGLAAAGKLREIAPEARVVFLSVHDEPDLVRAAFEVGAWGYLLKSSAPHELLFALETVLAGQRYVTPGVTGALLPMDEGGRAGRREGGEEAGRAVVPPKAKLGRRGAAGGTRRRRVTRREHEVLTLLARGLSNREIAEELFVSEVTVRTHVRNLQVKLDLHNRVELALYALQRGWADLPGTPPRE